MQQGHRETLVQTEYGRELLGRLDEQERFRRRMKEVGEELRRLGTELRDQRLLAIADGYAREVTYLPSIYLSSQAGGWEKSQEDLKRDRERIEPKARRWLQKLEAKKCEPIEWHEARRVERVRIAEKYPRIETPEDAERLVKDEVPFAELTDDAQRTECLKVFARSKSREPEKDGAKRACEVLAKYYRLFHAPRDHLSLRFAQEENVTEKRTRKTKYDRWTATWRQDLWTLLCGVRELSAKTEGLGAPEDVKVCLGAWLARVRNVAYFHDPFYPPHRKITEELDVRPEGNRLVRNKRNPHSHPRFRDGRKNLEAHLLKAMTPKEVAVLETAWLLPVAGEKLEAMKPLSAASASARKASNRLDSPIGPLLDNGATPEANRKEASAFYSQAVEELTDLRKKAGRKQRGRKCKKRGP